MVHFYILRPVSNLHLTGDCSHPQLLCVLLQPLANDLLDLHIHLVDCSHFKLLIQSLQVARWYDTLALDIAADVVAYWRGLIIHFTWLSVEIILTLLGVTHLERFTHVHLVDQTHLKFTVG